MIFPGFPGVLSFFQVFQVEWEPCLQQNSVTLFGQFVKWHDYSSTFSSVVCFSQNQFELFLVWIFGSFGNALPFSKKMYYSAPWFGCIVCGCRSISEAWLLRRMSKRVNTWNSPLHMSHFSYSCKFGLKTCCLPLNFNMHRKVWWWFFRISTQFSTWFSTCLTWTFSTHLEIST